MKRNGIMLATIVFGIIILLSSCSVLDNIGGVVNGKEKQLYNQYFLNDKQEAEELFKSVIKAINDDDQENLKALFSEKALIESDIFNSSIIELMNFANDKVTWDTNDDYAGPITGGDFEDGEQTIVYEIYREISIGGNWYLLYLLYYPVDTINPSNVGLYSLYIWNERNGGPAPWECYHNSGIKIWD